MVQELPDPPVPGISAKTGTSSIFATRFSQSQKTSAPAGNRPMRQGKILSGFPVLLIRPAQPLIRIEISEPIQDLIGPKPLQTMQRLVQRRELLVRDAAHLLHRLDVLLIK